MRQFFSDADGAGLSTIEEWSICTYPIGKWLNNSGHLVRYFKRGELDYLESLRCEKRRREWGGGRIAAKLALHNYCSMMKQEPPELSAIMIHNSEYLENKGQPVAKNMEAYISISHSQQYAVAVASPYAVGVDIERVRSFSSEVQQMILTDGDRDFLGGVTDEKTRNDRMTLIWCFKEAFMKAQGQSVFGWFGDLELTDINRDGELTWRISSRLAKYVMDRHGQQLRAIGEVVGDYAISIVGRSAKQMALHHR
jgi:phosphopantetheinyl transferase